jgi:hypothetical protein
MSAETKHTFALITIAVGTVALFIGGSAGVAAVTTDKPGWFGCTAVCGLVGLIQIRRGLKMRNAAVAEGSTLIEQMEGPDEGTGHTTRTETRKPTFLRKKEETEKLEEDDE